MAARVASAKCRALCAVAQAARLTFALERTLAGRHGDSSVERRDCSFHPCSLAVKLVSQLKCSNP
jgi:hypothetical protein